MIDPNKVEVLKVWYSLFTVIMDDEKFTESDRLNKLYKLRARLAAENPELEAEIQNFRTTLKPN